MHTVHSLDGISYLSRNFQIVVEADAADNQHPAVFLYFSCYVPNKIGRFQYYLARCQRAGKGAC